MSKTSKKKQRRNPRSKPTTRQRAVRAWRKWEKGCVYYDVPSDPIVLVGFSMVQDSWRQVLAILKQVEAEEKQK